MAHFAIEAFAMEHIEKLQKVQKLNFHYNNVFLIKFIQ